jgi:guanylate kinase
MADLPLRRGIIFILSAPSGSGKTTISKAALREIRGLEASISITTRGPREGEIDGVDYKFVTYDEFKRSLDASEMAESARVFDAYYGTPRRPLEDAVASGRDLLLDIDVQGARQIRNSYSNDVVTIFVLPPTFGTLEDRLRRRGTEGEAAIERRLRRAAEEASAYPEYDYLLINDDIGDSISRLAQVVAAERLKVKRLREEFAPWTKR